MHKPKKTNCILQNKKKGRPVSQGRRKIVRNLFNSARKLPFPFFDQFESGKNPVQRDKAPNNNKTKNNTFYCCLDKTRF